MASATGLVILAAACSGDGAGPMAASSPADSTSLPATIPPDSAVPADTTAPIANPTDSTAPPVDSTGSDSVGVAALDPLSSQAGIVFGSFNMGNSDLNSVHTGWMNGGPLDPSNIISWLDGARAKGARVVIKLSKGKDHYVQNGDRTFSLTKWKALVSRYRNVNLGPYIADGTIIGHYLIDEPQRAERWGGKVISQATLEEMAQYSKEVWPQMTTLVRVVPSWLASAAVSYRYLDAGWLQYASGKGDAGSVVRAEASAARRKGLGLVVGMNVMDGGNGSSKIRGVTGGRWAMSASEIRSYGAALVGESYACGFFNWTHNASYYGRSDIKSAMADISAEARNHEKTSCRQ
jgi:hypothetical protein